MRAINDCRTPPVFPCPRTYMKGDIPRSYPRLLSLGPPRHFWSFPLCIVIKVIITEHGQESQGVFCKGLNCWLVGAWDQPRGCATVIARFAGCDNPINTRVIKHMQEIRMSATNMTVSQSPQTVLFSPVSLAESLALKVQQLAAFHHNLVTADDFARQVANGHNGQQKMQTPTAN